MKIGARIGGELSVRLDDYEQRRGVMSGRRPQSIAVVGTFLTSYIHFQIGAQSKYAGNPVAEPVAYQSRGLSQMKVMENCKTRLDDTKAPYWP
jgi:hypothetical protein